MKIIKLGKNNSLENLFNSVESWVAITVYNDWKSRH